MKIHQYFARLALSLMAILLSGLVTDHTLGRELSVEQQRTILSEASTLYEKGEASSTDRALLKETYAEAATKYQTLVDDGVNSWEIYFNLGNAYLQSGRLGPAITNYQRAAMVTNNKTVHANLKHAKSLVKVDEFERETASTLEDMGDKISAIPVKLLSLAAVLSWTCAWIAFSFSHPSWQRPTKMLGFLAASLFLVALCSLSVHGTKSQQPAGIVTTNQALLREGNGIAFRPLDKEAMAEGSEVQVLEQRGDWFHVQLKDGKTGWLSDTQVEII